MMSERNYSVWGIPIISSYSKTLAHKSSNHFYIITDYDMSDHETFYFSSPQLHNIDIKNPEFAFYRSKALLRLMNGMREIRNYPPIMFDQSNIYFFEESGKQKRFTIRDNPQLEYEELQRIFSDNDNLNDDNIEDSFNSYEVDVFELASQEELVKESVILFTLSKEEPLYFLINTSKIIENIKFDLGIVNRNYESEALEKVSKVLGRKYESFYNAYKFLTKYRKNGFQRFINTRDGSGIFSRHGKTNQHYRDETTDEKLPVISFEETENNIQTLIFEWINYKLLQTKRYRYGMKENVNRIDTLNDDDFQFDL